MLKILLDEKFYSPSLLRRHDEVWDRPMPEEGPDLLIYDESPHPSKIWNLLD